MATDALPQRTCARLARAIDRRAIGLHAATKARTLPRGSATGDRMTWRYGDQPTGGAKVEARLRTGTSIPRAPQGGSRDKRSLPLSRSLAPRYAISGSGGGALCE
jgi:hypothetical protein